MKELRFMHIADLHLDSPFVGLKHLPPFIFQQMKDSTFKSLTQLVTVAITEKIDFLLIAGDIYDEKTQSIRAQARFIDEMERLQTENIPVYAILGNHDYNDGTLISLDLPQNVHLFSAETETVYYKNTNGTTAAIHGFSYNKKHLTDRRVETFEKASNVDFNIALYHGEETTTGGNYAPFSRSEMLQKNFDYWALGHIHKKDCLNEEPLILYPGNIQGRHRKETGPKGGMIISLSEKETKATFYPAAEIVWEERSLTIKPDISIDHLLQKLTAEMDKAREESAAKVFLALTLLIDEKLNKTVSQKIINEEVIERLQDLEQERDDFVWVYQLKTYLNKNITADWWQEETAYQSHWEGAIQQLSQEQQFNDVIQEMTMQRLARRYVDVPNTALREQIIEDAVLLIGQLIAEEGEEK